MLQEIKKYINQLTTDNNVSSRNSTNLPLETIPLRLNDTIVSSIEMPEEKIIREFEALQKKWENLPNFPKRANEPILSLIKVVQQINFEDLTISEQSIIRKILEQEIVLMIDIYLSLPKAHAVSVILDNGKTSKDTLIEKLHDFTKQVTHIYEEAVEEKTRQLVKQQKKAITINTPKKDFFDL